MNKTYNVIFNKSIGEYQVTSELTSSKKKTKSSKRMIVTLASLLFSAAGAQGIDDGGQMGVPYKSNINTLSHIQLGIEDIEKFDADNTELTNIATWTNANNNGIWDSEGNWQTIDSDGNSIASSSFVSNRDYAQFHSTDDISQTVKIDTEVNAAGLYFSGKGTYRFEAESEFNSQALKASYTGEWGEEVYSSGMLVLGQEVIRDAQTGLFKFEENQFSGIVDLTGTTKNYFDEGISIYGGALRISSADQIQARYREYPGLPEYSRGTTHIRFNSKDAENPATLLISGEVTITDNILQLEKGHYGVIQAEDGGELIFTDPIPFSTIGIWNGGTLTIDGIRFENSLGIGPSISNGGILSLHNLWHENSGVIENSGDLTITDARIGGTRGESATTSYDRVVLYNQNHLTLKSTMIEDNILDNRDGILSLRSVAFYNNGGTMEFEDVSFINNHIWGWEHQESYGGAIYNLGGEIYDNNGGMTIAPKATIAKTNFINNSVSYGHGGAIFNNGDLTISDAFFQENKTIDGNGGGIYNDWILTVENSIFEKNSAHQKEEDWWWGSQGGAIFYNSDWRHQTTLLVRDSTFNENSADYGGAIAGSSTDPGYFPLDVSDSTFTANSAVDSGGAISANAVDISYSTFTRNSAGSGGGAIFATILNVKNSSFLDNSVDDSVSGGAINAATLDLIVSGDHTSLFSGNSAKGQSNSIAINNGFSFGVHLEDAESVLEMHDPLSGYSYEGWPGPEYEPVALAVTKDGLGHWKLGGVSHFTGVETQFSVNEGLLSFYGKNQAQDINGYDIAASKILLDGSLSGFTLGSQGKSAILEANGGNQIVVKEGKISFFADDDANTNTTVRLNVTGENRLNDLNEAASDKAVLGLEGAFEVTGGGKVKLEVFGLMEEGALYALLSSNQDHAFNANQFEYSESSINLTYLGRDISTIERLKSFDPLMINEKGNALIFNNIQEDNGRLTAISSWTGNGGSNNWGSSADANWQTIDSAGVVVENSIFMAGDFVNFALLNEDYGAKWETINLVLNEDDPNYKITSAGVYFSGGVSYKFSGEGFHTTIDKTTFNPSASSGKLVLGGKVESEEAGGISVADADFWGTVDLTGTTQNSFEGGVEIYDGILKISHEDQLGTTLDKLRLAGTYVPDYYFKAVGKLLIDGDVQFNNQTLTIEHDFFGEIELENGTLKFANNNNRLILDNAAKDSDVSNSFIVAATNGTIIFDNSQNDASAIYNHDQGKLSISKALFTGNISGSDASIIKTDTKAQTFISSSRFALNNQLGIHVSDGSLELYDVLFENGTRGAIDADSGSPVSIYASSFINNQRIDKDGGAISSDAFVGLSSLSSSTPEF